MLRRGHRALVGMYQKAGMVEHLEYNFVMGVASGMPADAELLKLLVKYREPGTVWQTTLIGREEIWAVHQATADLGGMLRTGVEDTFYLPGGEKTSGNGQLIEALAACAKHAGREVASPAEARQMLGLREAKFGRGRWRWRLDWQRPPPTGWVCLPFEEPGGKPTQFVQSPALKHHSNGSFHEPTRPLRVCLGWALLPRSLPSPCRPTP